MTITRRHLDRTDLDALHSQIAAQPDRPVSAEDARAMLREIERLRDIISEIESSPERDRIEREHRLRGADWMRDAVAAQLRRRGFGRMAREMAQLCEDLIQQAPDSPRRPARNV